MGVEGWWRGMGVEGWWRSLRVEGWLGGGGGVVEGHEGGGVEK